MTFAASLLTTAGSVVLAAQEPKRGTQVQAVQVTPAARAAAQETKPAHEVRSLLDLPGHYKLDLDRVLFEADDSLTKTTTAGGRSFSVSAQAAVIPPATPTSPSLRIYSVTINQGTPDVEKFLVAPASGLGAKPMLVLFHAFGFSYYDPYVHTDFFAEGINRGWHVIAPFGGSQTHFSSLESQIKTEAALNWMLVNFSVDKQRVYGVGFSMGGGAVMNYAARHLDPSGVMFAAVVNHTGVVALEDAYLNEPGARPIFDNIFGNGTPGSYDPWKMQRSSVISFDPLTLVVDPTTDLARNLLHLYTRTVTASQDPVAYLITQNSLLHGHLLGLGAPFGQHGHYVFNSNTHSWDLLNERAACDWLRTKRLKLPDAGNTLADHDGTYFHFTVTQAAGGAFTPFVWDIDRVANTLALSATSNLAVLSVDTAGSGLQPLAPFTATLSTADGQEDDLRLRGWNHLPINVLRDGIATGSWNYNPSTGDLALYEYDGTGVHVWNVVP